MTNPGDRVSGSAADAWDEAARQLETHVAPSVPSPGRGSSFV